MEKVRNYGKDNSEIPDAKGNLMQMLKYHSVKQYLNMIGQDFPNLIAANGLPTLNRMREEEEELRKKKEREKRMKA